MKYCSKCGKEIIDEAVICPGCGCAQGNVQESFSQTSQGVDNSNESTFVWAVLGFFVPLAGLILYILWKDTNPSKAKSAGKGALISVVISVVLSLIMCIVGIVGGAVIGSGSIFY